MFETVFNNCISRFDFNDKNIRLKYNHSYRVRNLALKYAYLLNFSNRDKYIAEFIALFHDIGRFYQLDKFNTYDDSISMDHACYGVKILLRTGILDDFGFNEEEKNIITFAIQNHNKYAIEKCDDERKIMHAKFIRDMDKLDIIYLCAYLDEGKLECEDIPINEDVINIIKNRELIRKKNETNYEIIEYFSYVFDINNDIIIDEFANNLDQFYKRLNNEKILKELYKESKGELERRKKLC